MSVKCLIEDQLTSSLNPEFLDVENESHKHNVPPGSESHFKVTIVSGEFTGLSLINRHRRINELLDQLLKNDIHALSIHAYTPEEWKERSGISPESPPCLGGGR